ncbi:MAG: YMGG-like glycine zipper-containing protein [Rickettsiales bacterium]|jgi:osmotically inducible lipoprotein OsmB
MNKMQNILFVISALTLLSACGRTTSERTLSGAGIGAGIGTVGGAIAGANPVAGALVGAAVGGAVGAVVPDEYINLGRPTWK